MNGAEPEPAISVIIPCYDSAEWITDALDSIFEQTYRDVEVIVVNDGSPDTERLETAIAPYRERVVYLKQENRGPSAARNTGIRRARGEYVAFLDSDDSWFQNHLAEQVKMLRNAPSLDLVYSDVLMCSDPRGVGTPYSQTYPSTGPVTFESLVRETCAIPTSSVVARRSAVIEAGMFDERFWRSEDFHLWLRMAHRGARMAYQERALGRHRVRAESLSSDAIKLLEAMVQVLQDVDSSVELTAGARAVVRQKIAETQARCDIEKAKECVRAGKVTEAAAFFQSANSFDQKIKYRLVLWGLRLAPRWTRRGIGLLEAWRRSREPSSKSKAGWWNWVR